MKFYRRALLGSLATRTALAAFDQGQEIDYLGELQYVLTLILTLMKLNITPTSLVYTLQPTLMPSRAPHTPSSKTLQDLYRRVY